MSRTELLIAEVTQEGAATRRLLERVPQDRMTWKPHTRSMSLGELAMHVAALPFGIAGLLDELVREIPIVPRREATSTAELLSTLDRSIAFASEKLWEWGDKGLADSWRMVSQGRTLVEGPRGGLTRSLMLNHWYHHRGQLTVYLRLLEVPLPPLFGPTADENPLA